MIEPFQTASSAAQIESGAFRPLQNIVHHENWEDGAGSWNLHSRYDDGNAGRYAMSEPDIGRQGAVSNEFAWATISTDTAGSKGSSIFRPTAHWMARDRNGDGSPDLPSRVRLECVFTWKGNLLSGSREDTRWLGWEWDCENDTDRFGPMLRWYAFDSNDNQIQEWRVNEGTRSSPSFTTVGSQKLCANEPDIGESAPQRFSWHYFRMDYDFEDPSYIEMQCNDKIFDLSGYSMGTEAPEGKLRTLMNPIPGVSPNHNNFACLFMDSICISTGVEN